MAFASKSGPCHANHLRNRKKSVESEKHVETNSQNRLSLAENGQLFPKTLGPHIMRTMSIGEFGQNLIKTKKFKTPYPRNGHTTRHDTECHRRTERDERT